MLSYKGVGPTGYDLLATDEVGASHETTPSVAFGDISPSRGEIAASPGLLPALALGARLDHPFHLALQLVLDLLRLGQQGVDLHEIEHAVF